MTMTTNWIDATQAVNEAQSIVVVSHVSPDGDAFGSLLGIGNALLSMGKQVDMAIDGGPVNYVQFLPGIEHVKAILDSGEWDLFISVDTSDEERTGVSGAYARAYSQKVINLDHHPTNTMFGDIHLVKPTAVSATEVIFEWLQTMNYALIPEVAIPLLTGLVTDTLGFRTSNVTSDTLGIAQQLMAAGASLTEVTQRTLDNRSFQELSLWKHMLNTVKLRAGGVITAEVTRADLRAVGMSDTTDAGLVSFLIKTNEAMIAAVFKETPEGRIELSFRCKPGFDVSSLAYQLGGGGHKQAAGATIDGPMETARERVLPLLKAAALAGELAIG
jgi:phosphoesterase RecJ-like protein